MREKQKVHFGVTRSGRPGLFTGNFLAWPLTHGEADTLQERVALCDRLNFEYVMGISDYPPEKK